MCSRDLLYNAETVVNSTVVFTSKFVHRLELMLAALPTYKTAKQNIKDKKTKGNFGKGYKIALSHICSLSGYSSVHGIL